MKRNDTNYLTDTRWPRVVAIFRSVAVALGGALLLSLAGCGDKPAEQNHALVKGETPPIAESALAKAAIQGDLAEIKTLLDAGADVNSKDALGRTPQ